MDFNGWETSGRTMTIISFISNNLTSDTWHRKIICIVFDFGTFIVLLQLEADTILSNSFAIIKKHKYLIRNKTFISRELYH